MGTTLLGISEQQYRGLQKPLELPSPAEIFAYEVETLVAKGLASYEDADSFRKMELPSGLFIFVPTQPKVLDLEHLMGLIEYKGETGANYLSLNYLKDEIEAPATPYIMVGVEDGKSRLNIKPSVSRTNIKAEGRLPYTTWRGIIHAVIFPEVFGSHNMDLVDSRYRSDSTPCLYLSSDRPGLSAYLDGVAFPEWGAPSCGSVIVP